MAADSASEFTAFFPITPSKAASPSNNGPVAPASEQGGLPILGLYLRRSNCLSLLAVGLRVYESPEGLIVVRAERCELHPDSPPTLIPPDDSTRRHGGQFGRLTEGQMQVSADGKQFLRAEAEPRFTHVFSIHDVVRRPMRQDDRQKCS